MSEPRPPFDDDDPALLVPVAGPLERFDVAEVAAANDVPGYHRSLARVNDGLFRLSLFEGEYEWHRHAEDELFFVLEGRCELDAEGHDPIPLGPGQGIVVPRGTLHRPRAAKRTVLLLVEGAGIRPGGD